MKTAVSISDDLFRRAEASARTWKMTRSSLYAKALEEFLDRRSPARVTAALDEVYSREQATVDPGLFAATLRSIPTEKW
jgi:hypothetical protein